MKRLDYIDIMKGITILLVLIGHYIMIKSIGTIIWSFHMPLFIFISGYFYKKITFNELLKRNIKKYILPYIIVCTIILFSELLIYSIYNFFSSKPVFLFDIFIRRIVSGLYGIASNSTLHRPNFVVKIGAIWFLNALFMGEILLYFILKIKRVFNQILMIIFILLLACIQTANICIPFGINYGCAFLGWLYIGYIFKKYNFLIKFDINFKLKASIFLLWLIVVVIEYITNNSFNIIYLSFPLYGLEILGAFCGILNIRWLSIWINNFKNYFSKILIELGRNTIWILCVHAIDIELWNYISRFIFGSRNFIGLIRIILDIVLAFIIKQLVFEYKNKKLRRN